MRTGLFVTGIILAILGSIGYVYPVSEYGSVSDLHELCSSGLGQLAKIFSGDARENCLTIKNMLIGIYALIGVGVILIIIGNVLGKISGTIQPRPLSKGAKKAIITGGSVTAGIIIGIFLYSLTILPNISVSDVIVNSVPREEFVTVLDYGRVPNYSGFYYDPTVSGTYSLVFSNDFSFISTKYVEAKYTDNGKYYTQSFQVPAGSQKIIPVYASSSQVISGDFSVSGGSGNDIDFYIGSVICSQTVTFSFNLINTGPVDGNTEIILEADGQSVWSNSYFIEKNTQSRKDGKVTISDCYQHEYFLTISKIERAE